MADWIPLSLLYENEFNLNDWLLELRPTDQIIILVEKFIHLLLIDLWVSSYNWLSVPEALKADDNYA